MWQVIVLLKRSSVLVAVLLFVFSMNSFAADDRISVSARSAVVINADTGQVLYEKNADEKRSMASTTKIMTSLIALEQHTPGRIVEVKNEMLKTVEGTAVGLKNGDLISMEALVYSMLLESGNDAANVAAYAIAKDEASFAALMNEKAREIGMVNSNFVTPSGLDSQEHYSTAYDMALLGAYAIKNPEFKVISASKNAVVSFGNPQQEHYLHNHNKMLNNYEGACGIKTGFTKKSGRCLVTAATRNSVTLVCALLNAPNDWDDTQRLLDACFEMTAVAELGTAEITERLNIAGGLSESIALELKEIPKYSYTGTAPEVTVKKYIKPFEYAPLKKGDIVGCYVYYNGDNELLRIPVLAAEDADQSPVLVQEKKEIKLIDKIRDFLERIKGSVKK